MTELATGTGPNLKPNHHWCWRWCGGVGLLVLGVFVLGIFFRPTIERYYDRVLKLPRLWGDQQRGTGPWGELTTVPITIGAPEDLLPVREYEANPPHWFLQGLTRDDFAKMLERLGVPGGQREELLKPAALHEAPEGVEVDPPTEVVFKLVPAARREIYRLLASSDRGSGELVYVPAALLDDRFRKNHVAPATVALFKQLSCAHGRYRIFSGMSCMLAAIPTYDAKMHFLQALTQQQTFLVYLRISDQSDISALVRYWGRSSFATDVKPMLESLAVGSGRVRLDIIELMPPVPTALLYTYPIPQNPMKGPVVRQDCFWTAFNFFRDVPNNDFTNLNYVAEKLRDDYFPVQSDPRFGDVVAFADPNRFIMHAAVYIADDIVYTKNGYSVLYPWIFTTVADLVELYSFKLPPGQKVQATYFRNKYY